SPGVAPKLRSSPVGPSQPAPQDPRDPCCTPGQRRPSSKIGPRSGFRTQERGQVCHVANVANLPLSRDGSTYRAGTYVADPTLPPVPQSWQGWQGWQQCCLSAIAFWTALLRSGRPGEVKQKDPAISRGVFTWSRGGSNP